MGRIIAKISLICWGFVVIFTNVIVAVVWIPPKHLAVVSMILGLIITTAVGFDCYRIARKEKLDSEWVLAAGKGFWRVLLILTGLSLFLLGLFAEVFPKLSDQLIENGGMTYAKVFVALFWLALISTFLGWALICFSEAFGYWRLSNFKAAFGGFALAMLWQLFGLLFSYLFLEVVNDVFFRLSASVGNWTLVLIAVFTVIAGLWMGKYEDLKILSGNEKK